MKKFIRIFKPLLNGHYTHLWLYQVPDEVPGEVGEGITYPDARFSYYVADTTDEGPVFTVVNPEHALEIIARVKLPAVFAEDYARILQELTRLVGYKTAKQERDKILEQVAKEEEATGADGFVDHRQLYPSREIAVRRLRNMLARSAKNTDVSVSDVARAFESLRIADGELDASFGALPKKDAALLSLLQNRATLHLWQLLRLSIAADSIESSECLNNAKMFLARELSEITPLDNETRELLDGFRDWFRCELGVSSIMDDAILSELLVRTDYHLGRPKGQNIEIVEAISQITGYNYGKDGIEGLLDSMALEPEEWAYIRTLSIGLSEEDVQAVDLYFIDKNINI